MRAEMRSFNAACRVMDLLVGIGNGVYEVAHAAAELKGAMAAHLRLHKAAYGKNRICNRAETLLT